jgi:hypothetical protein
LYKKTCWKWHNEIISRGRLRNKGLTRSATSIYVLHRRLFLTTIGIGLVWYNGELWNSIIEVQSPFEQRISISQIRWPNCRFENNDLFWSTLGSIIAIWMCRQTISSVYPVHARAAIHVYKLHYHNHYPSSNLLQS